MFKKIWLILKTHLLPVSSFTACLKLQKVQLRSYFMDYLMDGVYVVDVISDLL